MENKKLPPTETYVSRPHEIRAHQLADKDQLGDVMWSGFYLGAAVLVTDLDQYGVPRSRQVIAQTGDYLVWRDDNKGWKSVIKRDEFEKSYRRSAARSVTKVSVGQTPDPV